jgi:bisphosphoglycerate-independent phosphoglycerate mutase (AlkP superfamily)
VYVDTDFVNLIKSKIKKEIKVWKESWNGNLNKPALIDFGTDRTNICHVCNNKYGKKGVVCSECGRCVHAKCISYRNDTEQLCDDCCADGWDTRPMDMMPDIKYNDELNDGIVFGTDAVLTRYY